MSFLLEHTVFFDGTVNPALIGSLAVLVGVCTYCHIKLRRLKRLRDELMKSASQTVTEVSDSENTAP